MNELTYLLFGKCAMFWCSFTLTPDSTTFEMRVNNTQTGDIEINYIDKSALFLELNELECAALPERD